MREVVSPSVGRTSRSSLLCLAALLLAGGISALVAGPASASVSGHSYSTSFSGSGADALTNPAGMAIDNSTGDVYVTDPADHRVEKFDAAGNFLLMFGKEVNSGTGNPDVCTDAGAPTDVCIAGASGLSAGAFVSPAFVAVDNSTGASKGDVYVADLEYLSPVQKFDPSGNLVTSWGQGGQLHTGSYEWEEIAGLAVGPHGNLFVLDSYSYVHKFSQGGVFEEFHTDFNSGIPLHYGPSPGAAIDSNENFYYGYYETGAVIKFAPLQTATEEERPRLGVVTPGGSEETGLETTGMAIDSAFDDSLYVDNKGTRVDVYSPSCSNGCTAVETFGTGHLTEGKGIAVNPTTHTVYVADDAGGKVAVFTPIIAADVRAKPTSEIGPTSLRLNGTVDPAGGPSVTECKFEYGTSTGVYGPTTLPCEAATSLPFAEPTEVHAVLSGISLNTKYHYRLVVTTTNGASDGADQVAEAAPEPPIVDGTSSSNVNPTVATLEASVNPNLGATAFRFQYGEGVSYEQQTYPSASIGEDAVDHPVSVEVPGLTPNTTYHFRVVATNLGGTAVGPDATFTTPAPPQILEQGASAIAQTSLTLSAAVNPNLRPTTYHFDYGITAAYGTSTQESGSVGSDHSPHSFSVGLSGLNPGTTYHYRVVATNNAGSVAGVDQTFTTQPAPIEEPVITKPAKCKPGFVKKHGKCTKKKKPHHRRSHKHA